MWDHQVEKCHQDLVEDRIMCGWSIDSLTWFHIRDKILKDRYAGCAYSAMLSNSPVIIRHREKLNEAEMREMADLFPENIRVEFQEVNYEGEQVELFENIFISEILFRLNSLGVFSNYKEYKEKNGKWVKE